MSRSKPIPDKIKRLRQRQLASGKWRVWWEPEGAVRKLGFEPVDLDAARATWSARQAKQLNEDVDRARRGESLTPRAPAGGRTISALIEIFKGSRQFLERKEATRAGYIWHMGVIEKKWGDALVKDFTKPVMNQWYEALLKTGKTTLATSMLRHMSILFSFAELIGWRAECSNPCQKLRLKVARKRKRHATWPEFDALLDAADRLGFMAMKCGIAQAVLSSQRQLDVIGTSIDGIRTVTLPDVLGRPVECLAWELVRSKRDNYGIMPLHGDLAPLVRAQMGDRTTGPLLIDEATGAPYSGDLFRKRWAAIRTEAARKCPSLTTPGNPLQFRDLRRTFGVWARAGGASREDIGDVLGNSAATDPQLGEIYMPPSLTTTARAVFSIVRPTEKE